MNKELLLLDQLKKLSMVVHEGFWKEFILSQIEIFEAEYISATREKKREKLLTLEGMYGGMGTLNDELTDLKKKKYLIDLVEIIDDELRRNWQELGKPSNNITTNELYAIGQFVELVEGEVWCVESSGRDKRVPEQSHLINKQWKISAMTSPDITNMPVYSLSKPSPRGGTQLKHVRHNALRLSKNV